MNDNKDTLEEIADGMDWYYNNSDIATVERLLTFQDKMTVHSFRLSEIASDQKKDYNIKYFSRKIEMAKSKQGFIKNQDMAVNRSEIDALIQNEDIFKQEIESESYAIKCELLLRQTNKLLDAIRQRISFLKDEKRHSITQV